MRKNLLFSVVLFFISCAEVDGQTDFALELQADRDSINTYFSNPETTQLTDEDLANFTGLHFYPANEEFVIPAEFELIVGAPVEEFATTTSRMAKYRAKGYLHFELEGKSQRLTVYENVMYTSQPHYNGSLFLPFTDVTNGKESYGGGRYLDFNINTMNNVVIDFNRSYNPYCAYNPKYSCPIPPEQNDLNFEIKAGIKTWHH